MGSVGWMPRGWMLWAPRAGAQEKPPQVEVDSAYRPKVRENVVPVESQVESRNEAEEVRRSWSRKGLVNQG